jgi:hypothetical protein
MENIKPSDVAQFEGNYYIAVRNLKWVDVEHTKIDCEVNFSHVGFEEWTPFCADPNDYMPYSKQLFDECISGKWGDIAEFIIIPPSEPLSPEAMAVIRARSEVAAVSYQSSIPNIIL